MKTKAIFLFTLFMGSLLQAQNVKLDIVPHFLGIRADSLLLSMDVSIDIENMDSQNAVKIIPILKGENRSIALPYIQFNGKKKQKLYLRNQVLRRKSNDIKDNTAFLIAGIDDKHSRTVSYRTSLKAESWMQDAAIWLKRSVITPDGETQLKDTLLIAPQGNSYSLFPATQEIVQPSIPNGKLLEPMSSTRMTYKGSYITPEIDEVDTRNQQELDFSLEEAKMIADITPQMLSLRELYAVAQSYTDNKAKFYQIIYTSVKLYPTHPTANLNAAAAAIEQGDTKAAGRFLPLAPRDKLAYKNCRGVYELMTGNTYEGIRMLKAAKAEGSEEAAYNLNVFFENNKHRP